MAFWHDYYGISVVGNGNDAYDCGYSLVCFVVCCDKVDSPFCFSVFLSPFPFQRGQNFFVSLSAFLFRLPLFTFYGLTSYGTPVSATIVLRPSSGGNRRLR